MGPTNHQPGCSTRMQAACRSKPRYRVLGRLDVRPGSALAGQSMEIAFRPLPAKRQTEFDPVPRPSSACALVAGNLVLAVSVRIRWVCGAPVAERPAWPGLLWMVPAGACGRPCVHAGNGGRLPAAAATRAWPVGGAFACNDVVERAHGDAVDLAAAAPSVNAGCGGTGFHNEASRSQHAAFGKGRLAEPVARKEPFGLDRQVQNGQT